jgi:hypothetical protein
VGSVRDYPYVVEVVPQNRVSRPRPIGSGVVLSDILRVDLPLYRKPVPGLSGLTEELCEEAVDKALEEAKILAYEKFVLFLQLAADFEPLLPVHLFRRYRQRRYVVLFPISYWTALRLQTVRYGAGQRLHAQFDEFELEFLAHPRLTEDEAYVIGRDKYCLYLHVECLPEEVQVFRSDFLDLESGAPPPIAVKARYLLSELGPNQARARAAADAEEGSRVGDEPYLHRCCPICGGRLLYLSAEEAFCLSCAWDNLKSLPRSLMLR